MSNEPIWKGDLKHCRYCRDAIFPHGHAPVDDSAPAPRASKKPTKAPRKSKATDTVAKITSGRRGRPMKSENWELLRVCNGDCT
jgi:hypothetical protein